MQEFKIFQEISHSENGTSAIPVKTPDSNHSTTQEQPFISHNFFQQIHSQLWKV